MGAENLINLQEAPSNVAAVFVNNKIFPEARWILVRDRAIRDPPKLYRQLYAVNSTELFDTADVV